MSSNPFAAVVQSPHLARSQVHTYDNKFALIWKMKMVQPLQNRASEFNTQWGMENINNTNPQ